MMYIKNDIVNRKQKGFSLVELMVSILIGLIILAGVVQVVVTSKTTFINQEEMSFIQENARYAVNQMLRDIKEAGYLGCAGTASTVALLPRAADDIYDLFAFIDPVTAVAEFVPLNGFESKIAGTLNIDKYPEKLKDVKPWQQDDADTDVIFIRRLSGEPLQLDVQQSNSLNVFGGGSRFENDDYIGLVGEDCRRLTILRAASSGSDTSVGISGANCSTNLKPLIGANSICGPACGSCNAGGLSGQRYRRGSEAFDFQAFAYFIGESSVINGEPALKRWVLSGDTSLVEELALGVEGLNVKYAQFDSAADEVRLITADEVSNWSQVVGVELEITFRSQSKTPQAAGSDYLRQTVKTYVEMRNS